MKYKVLIAVFVTFAYSALASAKNHEVSFNLNYVKRLADKASECGIKNGWKLSIAIVNSEGNLVYFERNDHAYLGSIEASIQKAKSANDT